MQFKRFYRIDNLWTTGFSLATLNGEVTKLLCTQREGVQNAGANDQKTSSRTDNFVSSVSGPCAGCRDVQRSTSSRLIMTDTLCLEIL
jgi:hypothetical protein